MVFVVDEETSEIQSRTQDGNEEFRNQRVKDQDGEDVDVLRRPDDDSYCNVEQKTYHFSQEKSNGSGYIIEAEIILREIEKQRNRPLV